MNIMYFTDSFRDIVSTINPKNRTLCSKAHSELNLIFQKLLHHVAQQGGSCEWKLHYILNLSCAQGVTHQTILHCCRKLAADSASGWESQGGLYMDVAVT